MAKTDEPRGQGRRSRAGRQGDNDALTSKVDRVFAGLEQRYGHHRWHSSGAPLDELIGTVLSQNTSNVNTARSFRSLRDRFPTWQEVIDAPEDAIVDAIRSGGLAQIKAPRIQAILRSISEGRGRLSLDHLAGLPIHEAKVELMALKGVGPKTAACVLLFSLGRPVMPVDTHVHRVSGRIGLVPDRTSAEACEPLLEELLGDDRDRILTAHLNLISHGQQICRAARPRCPACPLTAECDYFQVVAQQGPQAAPDEVSGAVRHPHQGRMER